MEDVSIINHIESLVEQEKSLLSRERSDAGGVHDLTADQFKLERISVELDRCWDLLRQRRALRGVGRDPNSAHLAADFIDELANNLSAWHGVAIARRADGALVISYKDLRLGVLYPDRAVAEIPFSGAERQALLEHQVADPATTTPGSTGVSHSVHGPGDITAVLGLFEERYRDIRGDGDPFGVLDSG